MCKTFDKFDICAWLKNNYEGNKFTMRPVYLRREELLKEKFNRLFYGTFLAAAEMDTVLLPDGEECPIFYLSKERPMIFHRLKEVDSEVLFIGYEIIFVNQIITPVKTFGIVTSPIADDPTEDYVFDLEAEEPGFEKFALTVDYGGLPAHTWGFTDAMGVASVNSDTGQVEIFEDAADATELVLNAYLDGTETVLASRTLIVQREVADVWSFTPDTANEVLLNSDEVVLTFEASNTAGKTLYIDELDAMRRTGGAEIFFKIGTWTGDAYTDVTEDLGFHLGHYGSELGGEGQGIGVTLNLGGSTPTGVYQLKMFETSNYTDYIYLATVTITVTKDY